MLAFCVVLMLGEVGKNIVTCLSIFSSSHIQVTFSLQISIGISRSDLVPGTLMSLSLVTTILATSLIVYRLHYFSKNGDSGSNRPYIFAMEVLCESGAMYAATLLVVCVLLTTRGTTFNTSLIRIPFWAGVLTPMAVSGWKLILACISVDVLHIALHRGSLQRL